MIKVHLKQGGSIRVESEQKAEWKIRYHGFVRFLEIQRSKFDMSGIKYFSIPMENVLFIEEGITDQKPAEHNVHVSEV
jgi:hypothetical protein